MEIGNLFGLPAHPLIVHSVVVLVPLVALGALAVVFWPGARARVGGLVAVGAVLNVLLTPLATGSGEALEEQVTHTAALEEHTELGELLLPWVGALAVLLIVHLVLARRTAVAPAGAGVPSRTRPASLLVAALLAVSAVGSGAMVALIGHNGAKATWSDVQTGGTGGEQD